MVIESRLSEFRFIVAFLHGLQNHSANGQCQFIKSAKISNAYFSAIKHCLLKQCLYFTIAAKQWIADRDRDLKRSGSKSHFLGSGTELDPKFSKDQRTKLDLIFWDRDRKDRKRSKYLISRREVERFSENTMKNLNSRLCWKEIVS